MNREMGAVVIKPMSKPWGLSCGAPISRSARTGLLPDFPVGVYALEASSNHSSSAATVTQAGGWNGLPAFSSFVRPTAGATRSELRDPSLRGACGS